MAEWTSLRINMFTYSIPFFLERISCIHFLSNSVWDTGYTKMKAQILRSESSQHNNLGPRDAIPNELSIILPHECSY